MKKAIVIGSGFSGLSAACYLAKAGFSVTVLEKNTVIGGRARQLKKEGFVFDTGPTFYWMPDVFDRFFADFGATTSDYYKLVRLDPGYEVYFGKNESIQLSGGFDGIAAVFEKYEPGSSTFLRKFIKSAEFNYRVAMDKVVYKPGKTPFELVMPATMSRIPQFVYSLKYKVRKSVKHPYLRQILEFPVLFLGAKSSDIPSFYRFMNYADMVLGTWHIEGGMYELVKGMKQLAGKLGVRILTGTEVQKINITDKKATGVMVDGTFHQADVIISRADYQHTETLLDERYRNYREEYWDNKVLAPSALLYYIGFNKKLENVSHHTLFFDTDFDAHAEKIYDTPGWPEKPLFYASFPTKTDPTLGEEGKETAIILIPVASGLTDSQAIRSGYFEQVIGRMEELTGQSLAGDVIFYESYAVSDFTRDYNAYKGNAYGLSNILMQTAFMKPKVQNKKVKNLFYTGQLTVPGPGVPTTIISGKIAAEMAVATI